MLLQAEKCFLIQFIKHIIYLKFNNDKTVLLILIILNVIYFVWAYLGICRNLDQESTVICKEINFIKNMFFILCIEISFNNILHSSVPHTWIWIVYVFFILFKWLSFNVPSIPLPSITWKYRLSADFIR